MKGKRFLRGWLFGVWAGLVFLGLPNEVLAGITGKIAGRIQDAATGEAIVGAVVVIDEIQRGGVTDEDGDYFIIDVPPGEYSLTASIIGYEKLTIKSVQVNIDRTVSVDFELETAAIEVEGVVVEMEREVVPMDVSASQAVVTGEEMSQQMSKNVIEALSLEPAVYNGQVRGGGTDETLLLMDGMRLVDERLNEAYLSINATAIEEVQINTGGFNAEYGNLRSGLFNVVTREGKPGQLGLFLNYRYSPAARKHFGSSAYGEHTTEWQVYAQDHGLGQVWEDGGQFLFEGSEDSEGNIALLNADGAVVRTVAPDALPPTRIWKGWNQVAADLVGDDDPDNDMTAEEAQALWKWQHRAVDYADAPDQDLDATLIGTMPGVDDLKFLISHRFEDSKFAMPQPRDGYKDQNTPSQTGLPRPRQLEVHWLLAQRHPRVNGTGRPRLGRIRQRGLRRCRHHARQSALVPEPQSQQHAQRRLAGLRRDDLWLDRRPECQVQYRRLAGRPHLHPDGPDG